MSSDTLASARCAALRTASASSPNCGRPRRRRFDPGDLADQPPQPLHEAPGALHAFLGPDHVALGRRVRQHEPARGVGAVGGDDVVGVDGVLLRLRHLLDRADLDRLAGRGEHGASRVARAFDLDLGRLDPVAVLRAVGLVHHHALREQAGERLVHADVPGLLHGAGEEARIRADAESRARCRRYIDRPASSRSRSSAWSAPSCSTDR